MYFYLGTSFFLQFNHPLLPLSQMTHKLQKSGLGDTVDSLNDSTGDSNTGKV